MTGGQHAVGAMTVPQITRVLAGRGGGPDHRHHRRSRPLPQRASCPAGSSVWDRSRLAEAQRVLAATPGVTVLIHDQACAAEKRRKRKRGKLPSRQARVDDQRAGLRGLRRLRREVQLPVGAAGATEFGRKTRIDQSSCNLDFSCLEGDCPSFMTVVPAAGRTANARGRGDQPGRAARPRARSCRPTRSHPDHRHRRHRRGHRRPGPRHRRRCIAGWHVRCARPDRAVAEGRRGRVRPPVQPLRRGARPTSSAPGSATSTWAATCWSPPTRRTSR